MAEANPQGPSLLTQHEAVEELLSRNAPQTDTASSEEPAVEEPQAESTELEAEAEVEVEATETEDAQTEDIVDDETEVEAEVVEEEPSPASTYRVQTTDGEVDVPLDELKNGYMRQSDYTRKTQQVAEERKSAESELGHLQAERQRYAEQLTNVEQALNQQEPTQEQWDQLYKENPLEYTRQRDVLRDRKEALEKVRAEQQQMQQQQLAELQGQAQQRMAHEREQLPELIPEWRDEKVAQKEKTALITFAQRYGYSEQELSNISDSRAVAVLRKAYLYDQLVSKNPAAQKKTQKAPKMTKAGQPQTKAQTSTRRKRDALANISKRSRISAVDAAVDYMTQK